jgi:predicted nucleic acid-binding protein
VVIDASAAIVACFAEAGFDLLPPSALQAPILVRSEVLASVQGMEWRREISHDLAEIAVERMLTAPVRLVRRLEVLIEARRLALAFGWAKTYDAEYVALALLSDEPLLTVDARLGSRVRGLVEVVTPADL